VGYWDLCEVRLIQKRSTQSAANALNVYLGPVPAGKIWVIQGIAYYPSVAETQVVSFDKYDGTTNFGLLNPYSMNLNPAIATGIEQGMELMLFPGEYVFARRVAATAGSSMIFAIQFVEIDLPLYTYEEPQVVKRTKSALSTIRQSLRPAGGGRPATEPTGGGGGDTGGGGRGLPI